MEDRAVIRLLVQTPDRVVLDEPVSSIRFQQPDGWRGVLPHHIPFLTRLVSGVLMYRLANGEGPHYLVLHSGTLEVQQDLVLVLTSAAESGRTLQELAERLEERQAEADALAFEAHIEFTKLRAALVRALTALPEAAEAIR